MGLYRLTRDADYDEHFGAIVRASSEAEARQLCVDELHPSEAWRHEARCVEITEHADAGIIMESFRAG